MYIIESIAQVQYDWSCTSNLICVAVNNGKNEGKKESYQNQLSKEYQTLPAKKKTPKKTPNKQTKKPKETFKTIETDFWILF